MPVTYVIDANRKLIHTVCSGPVVLADVIHHFRTLKTDPACTGPLDVLLDASDAESVPESNQLKAVTSEVAALREKVQFGLCAIVARRAAMFGMMRMFGVFAERGFGAIRVFHTTAEAEAWLQSGPQAHRPAC